MAELFEARRPKDNAIIAEITGTVEFGKDYKNKQRIIIKPDDENAEAKEYLIPRGKNLAVQHGDRIEKGDFVYDGHPAPHDILAIKGVEELANYLINEIQDVYRLQGVTINDKHIEVIVRQMLQKVEVEDPGETEFLKGEQIDRIEFDEINAVLEKAGILESGLSLADLVSTAWKLGLELPLHRQARWRERRPHPSRAPAQLGGQPAGGAGAVLEVLEGIQREFNEAGGGEKSRWPT